MGTQHIDIADVSPLFNALSFTRGPSLKNRITLAPLTNTQSTKEGHVTEDDYNWLTMRAKGGFGLVTTCASHVTANGAGFKGQLGCYSDSHISGLTHLAEGIKKHGGISSLQLHHAGKRALPGISRIGPSDDVESGTRAMSDTQIQTLTDDFANAALRAQESGFDGVQIHGGHGYIVTQFLSGTTNQRTDKWGGSVENRSRFLMTLIEKIRSECRSDFQIGVRLSPERFGLHLQEMTKLTQRLIGSTLIDYIDLSLWDVEKEPEEPALKGKKLISYFTEAPRGQTRIGVAGKIMDGKTALRCLKLGADYVAIGRAGILAHDFPRKVMLNGLYESPELPVSTKRLQAEGVGSDFIDYLRSFRGFIK